ncbi:MAG: hypothetical protein ACTHN9_20235 [Trinickia sp.]
MNQIDPIEFGRVLARLDEQDTQIAALRTDVQALLALANRGKGALFTLTSLGAAIGAVLGVLGHHIFGK